MNKMNLKNLQADTLDYLKIQGAELKFLAAPECGYSVIRNFLIKDKVVTYSDPSYVKRDKNSLKFMIPKLNKMQTVSVDHLDKLLSCLDFVNEVLRNYRSVELLTDGKQNK